jgi:hypothetical protein
VALEGCLPVTGVPTPTPTLSPSPTRSATPTASRTPLTGGTLGGHGFNLTINPGEAVHARWTGGTLQTGYLGVRIALPSSTTSFFPAGAAALGFDDPNPVDIACYVTLVQGGNPPGAVSYGQTDSICLFRVTPDGPTPLSFKLQLDELPTSKLSWTAPPGRAPQGYTLLAIPTDGSGVQFLPQGPGATSATHPTGGKVVCYELLVAGGGKTDALCAFPNASTLAAGERGPASQALDHLRRLFANGSPVSAAGSTVR